MKMMKTAYKAGRLTSEGITVPSQIRPEIGQEDVLFNNKPYKYF